MHAISRAVGEFKPSIFRYEIARLGAIDTIQAGGSERRRESIGCDQQEGAGKQKIPKRRMRILIRQLPRVADLWLQVDSAARPAAFAPRRESRALGYSGTFTPRWRHAAISVLLSNSAMVIGPTPPGTGVMAPAFG